MLKKTNSIITVDLSVLKENVVRLSSYLDENTGIMAVVKADAYAHGALKIAEALNPLAEAFAVNDIQEGIELRKKVVSKPILVFAAPEKPFASQYSRYNLIATVSSEEHFEMLAKGTCYHLNFDTGMGRLGFQPDEAERIAGLTSEQKEIRCTGIYSHFATSSEPGAGLVAVQHKQFEKIRAHFSQGLTTHIANTGGTVFYEMKQFDMVRLGIGMYGYSPGMAKVEGLKPVLKWKSRLVQVKKIKKNSTVSYGAGWKAPADGYLGVIPVGYADGLRRNLSGRFSVGINSKSYEVAGIITMNYCMVYLGDDYYKSGTEVELLHPKNSAADWARKIDTIPYEILTGINENIPRKYIG